MKSRYIIILFFLLIGNSINNLALAQEPDTLNQRSPFFEEIVDSVCLGDSYNWRGNDYSQAGQYYDSLLTTGGEDSIYKLTLSIYTIYKSVTENICNGDSALLEGNWQTTEGTYYDTINVLNQCDTVVITELVFYPNQSFNIEHLCEGDSIFLNGSWQTTAGMYQEHLTSSNGCDSTSITVVDFVTGGDTTINRIICEGDSIYFDGDYYSQSGTFTSVIPGENGCDSSITLKLSVIDLPDVNAIADPPSIEGGETSQLFIENYGTILWSPSDSLSCSDCNTPIASPTETTTFYVEMNVNNCTIHDSVTVTVKERTVLVDIPEGFSPNGDGINDYFEIRFIDEFPLNSLVIMNRWGNKVMEVAPYVNSWDGKNKIGGFLGKELPEGTYYYILKLDKNKEDTIKGYVYLKR